MNANLPLLFLQHPPMSGEQVVRLQELLENAGYSVYGKDGIFGPMTDEALRRFQEAVGITVDGVAGPQTWEELKRSTGKHKEIRSLWHQDRLEPQRWKDSGNRAYSDTDKDSETKEAPTSQRASLHIAIQPAPRIMTIYRHDQAVRTFNVAVGKPSTPTPPGEWKIRTKIPQPGSILGSRWLGLDIPWGNYGIHGTNAEWSIGRAVSNGCIRMYNQDVEWLFEQVERGTTVYIRA